MTIGKQNRINAEKRPQDWGVDNPIPALDLLLDELNRYREKQPRNWYAMRGTAYRKAARLLGVRSLQGADTESWNTLIDALTLYRADWRGFEIKNKDGAAA